MRQAVLYLFGMGAAMLAAAGTASAAPGDLDPTFGSGGKVATAFVGATAQAHGLVLQPDGKVVVVGTVCSSAGGNFGLVRYLADGSPDGTFGSSGAVTTAFFGFPGQAFAVALQS